MSDLLTLIKPSFAAGELAPSIWGRVDYGKWNIGASVMRNMFVSYRGPAYSRAGTLYACTSLTPASASSLPPKLIRFQYNIFQSYLLEFGVRSDGRPYMRVLANGALVTDAAKSLVGATQANPCRLNVPGNGYSDGDWGYIAGVSGMTQLNGRTVLIGNVTGDTFSIFDLFGNPINSLSYGAYTSGGTISRIFTSFDSPYQLADLPWLKVVQSADVMTLTCVNQLTGAEYPPIDLTRLAANSWVFDETTFASGVTAPTGCAASATATTGTTPTHYAYCVTAIDGSGEESVASNVAYINDSVDTSLVAGSHIITWNPVAGAVSYNIYQAPPAFDTAVPVGSTFGYIGTSDGTSFVNTNILADRTVSPPLHLNPFARGAVLGATRTSAGTGYTQATTTAAMVTSTGTGAVLVPVVNDTSGVVTAIIIENGGDGYRSTDTILVSSSGGGAGAAFTPVVGPQTGTYPGVADYFQQRRVYGHTLNRPDTLFASQTGSYTNMDAATPPIDSDAIVLTPWAQQVNGVQWMLPMPGGLIVSTGLDAWQVAGAGGPGSQLTPASESATPQESNGFSPYLRPLKINFDILYVQSLGYTVRDLQYNFVTNIYAGADLSLLSNHLFDGYELTSWAWAQIPWKIVWATRNDGRFLSLTYDKEEQLQGWARHDTNGLVSQVEVATEPPVNAPYFVVKRFIKGANRWSYFIERMDNRLWLGPEDPWCVDAGLALAQPAPAATLSAQAADGPGDITGGYLANGGQGYTAPAAQIIDPLNTGSGAAFHLTVAGGVITGFTFTPGAGYSPGTTVRIIDPTGSGATLIPTISQNVQFDASAPVFDGSSVGAIIRIGGGAAEVTQVLSGNSVLAAILMPILKTIPNDPYRLPVPAPAGTWTMTQPVDEVSNLQHLEGLTVTGLADGRVIEPVTVVNGAIPIPAGLTSAGSSSIKVGLPFIAQLQAMPVEISAQGTIQGKRKNIPSIVVRMEKSRGFEVGGNRPVASTLDFQEEVPWDSLAEVPEVPRAGETNAPLPLFTGDQPVNIQGAWQNWNGFEAAPGMVAAQQLKPLPMAIAAFIPDLSIGD